RFGRDAQAISARPRRLPSRGDRREISRATRLLRPEGGRTAEEEIREQLESVVLVEALVLGRDQRFNLSNFCQAREDIPRANWQVPWEEKYLSLDGRSVIPTRSLDVPEAEDFRVAFYIHFWDPARPLQTSYGPVPCPRPKRMPKRLERL